MFLYAHIRRNVHDRFGPQTDEREAPHHSHRRRQASAVQPKADRPPPANAGGIPPDRNVEARLCGAVELSSPIVLLKKKDGSCWFFADYQQLNNLTRKDAHRGRPSEHIKDMPFHTLIGCKFCTFVTTRWARSSGSLPPGPLQYARHHSWPAPLRSHGLVFVLSSSTFVSSHHSHSTLVHLLTDWMVSTAPIYRTILPQGGTGVGQLKFDPSIVLLTIPGLRPFYKSAASYAAALIRSTNGISLTGDDRTTGS
ncbi:hypothetical protein T05_6455 [Trichinella murrelli]|uniref:Transposon Ty3-I Gag-Pol polyprotein n=1 Tax=Trichinella murrelli TaxID=144512 RepID=A0A0V0TH66_9BILA|nr:hypothetical protein T05_6455 [Trichinella murrelli]